MIPDFRFISVLLAVLCFPCSEYRSSGEEKVTDHGIRTFTIGIPGETPRWASLQRQLLDEMDLAAREFVNIYTRPDGSLIWRQEWPGMDGSDDGYESFYNFPLFYVLGGSDETYDLSRKLWDAVTRQFTEYGQIYREFDSYYDWMHHGESYVYFYFFGLANPHVPSFEKRSIRFADFYTGTSKQALNYDPVLKLIRSPINGSRGPRFVNTAEDWVTHREVLSHYPLPYHDIPNVETSAAWVNDKLFPYILRTMNRRMMQGDVPLNLTATSLIANAYMVTGDPSYREWIREYVRAWIDRTEVNGGILPDNVGLTGRIGEHMEGRWWGGYIGWKWPHGLFNQLESTLIGASNAYLVSGNSDYLELPRAVLDLVAGKGRRENGILKVPNRHGEKGWYDYRPVNPSYLIQLWSLSQAGEDYERLVEMADASRWSQLDYKKQKGDFGHEGPWLKFIEGRYPDYPEDILEANLKESRRRLNIARMDTSRPEDRNVHHWQQRNPVVLEGLVQTMTGAPNHIYHGGLLHTRLRYFDPILKRPGLPADTAALVEKISSVDIQFNLVNLHSNEPRSIIIQAGAFGEHEILDVTIGQETYSIGDKAFQVQLRSHSNQQLRLRINRFSNIPSYRQPLD